MHQKLLKSAHYIELGSYQYWPVLVPRGIRLYTYEQIPVSLKDNPYITDGYRAYLPSRLCIKRYSLAASAGRAWGKRQRPVLLTCTLFIWSSWCFLPLFSVPLISCCPIFFIPFCHLSSHYLPSSAVVLDPQNNNDSSNDHNYQLSYRGFAVYKELLHPLFLLVLIGIHVGIDPTDNG